MQELTRRGIRFLKALWLALNPIASRRERLRLWAQIQTLKGRIVVLRGRIEALKDIPTPDNAVEVNSLESWNEFCSAPENVERYCASKRLIVYQLFLDSLAANVKIKKDSKILDAGCGLGIFTRLIQERFEAHDIHGFDFSDVAIAQARARSKGIKFFTHNIYDSLPEQYDVIVCTELIEHLIDPETAVRNLLACLSDEGTLFLTVPDGRVDRHVKHINFWSPESWEIFIKRLCQENYDVNFGIVQHPTVRIRRHNWATLKRRMKDIKREEV